MIHIEKIQKDYQLENIKHLLFEKDTMHEHAAPTEITTHEFEKRFLAYSKRFREHYEQGISDIFIAMNKEKIIGFIRVRIEETITHFAVRKRVYAVIEEIVVDKAYQKQGIGTKLLEAATNWAKEKSLSEIELWVWDFNTKAKSFYHAKGFFPTTIRMRKRL